MCELIAQTRNFLSLFPYAEATDLNLGWKPVELDSAGSQKFKSIFVVVARNTIAINQQRS